MTGDERDEEREFCRTSRPAAGAISPSGWRRSRPTALPTRTRPSTGCARRASRSRAPPGSSASTRTGPADLYGCAARARRRARPPPAMPRPAPVPRAPSKREAADLDKLIARRQGLPPRLQLLEAEIRKAVPGVAVMPSAGTSPLLRRKSSRRRPCAPRDPARPRARRPPLDPPLPPQLRGRGRPSPTSPYLADTRLVSGDLVDLHPAGQCQVERPALSPATATQTRNSRHATPSSSATDRKMRVHAPGSRFQVARVGLGAGADHRCRRFAHQRTSTVHAAPGQGRHAAAGAPAAPVPAAPAAPEKTRARRPRLRQPQRLMRAVDAILQDTAKPRRPKLPSERTS